MASLQATRLKKGMLINVEQNLFRVLEVQHVTPGNLRGFVRVKLRNIRNGTLSDQKLRSEDTLERATLTSPERIRRLALQLGMTPVAPDRIRIIDVRTRNKVAAQ